MNSYTACKPTITFVQAASPWSTDRIRIRGRGIPCTSDSCPQNKEGASFRGIVKPCSGGSVA